MLKATAQDQGMTGTKAMIMESMLETLREDGFAGASARAIARRGGFNQALIFYHFGSVTNLMLAALDETSRRRMAAYRAALEETEGHPEQLLDIAVRIYQEDLASGHITVLAELIAGSLAMPDLRPEIVARMEPWIGFAEEAIKKAVQHSPIGGVLPTRDLAFAVVAFYLGVELLDHLDDEGTRTQSLIETASAAFGMLTPLLELGK